MANLFGHFFALTCPVIKVSGKLQHYSGKITDGPDSSIMFGSLHQVKNHDPLRRLLVAKGIWNGSWKKVVINASYDHVVSLRNENCNHHECFFISVCVCVCVVNIFASPFFPLYHIT